MSLDEVTRLGAALYELEAEGGNVKAVNIAAIQIAGLRWSELNLDEGMLILDDSKTGKSQRPLGGAAVAFAEAHFSG